MKIGVNLIQYTDIQGIEVFAKNLLISLISQDSENEYVFFVNQESAKIFALTAPNLKIKIKNFKSLAKINLITYQQCGLIRELRKNKIDLLFCPSTAAPIFYKKKIITIHDCASLRFKDEAGWFSRVYLKLIFWSAKYLSLRVVTVSDFAKQEIITLLKIKPAKIAVISEGVPLLAEVDDRIVATVLNKFDLGDKKFFFYIGNLRPRKNIKRLLNSWSDFTLKYQDYYLVIAGKNDNQELKELCAKLDLKDNLIFTGVISETEKVVLYKKSLALVFLSLYEGFGLPVLEAQSLGVPVLTSNISSLPEVAGAGAILIDPCQQEAILKGLEKIIDPNFSKTDLIAKGLENLPRFSWDKSARFLLAIIKQLGSKVK